MLIKSDMRFPQQGRGGLNKCNACTHWIFPAASSCRDRNFMRFTATCTRFRVAIACDLFGDVHNARKCQRQSKFFLADFFVSKFLLALTIELSVYQGRSSISP